MLKALLLTVFLGVLARESSSSNGTNTDSSNCTCLVHYLQQEFRNYDPQLAAKWNINEVLKILNTLPSVSNILKLFNVQATSLQVSFQNANIKGDFRIVLSFGIAVNLKTPSGSLSVEGFRNQTIIITIQDKCTYSLDTVIVTGEGALTVKTQLIFLEPEIEQLKKVISTWCQETLVIAIKDYLHGLTGCHETSK